MSERIPTEAEWRLVAGVMGWTIVGYEDKRRQEKGYLTLCSMRSGLQRRDNTWFRPLRDYNDLARFVEAMTKAGWNIHRRANDDGRHSTEIFKESLVPRESLESWYECAGAPTDLIATFFACVDALKAEEEKE